MFGLNPTPNFQHVVNKRAIIKKKTDSRLPSSLYQSMQFLLNSMIRVVVVEIGNYNLACKVALK